MWDPNTRGKALAIFTLGPFAGPALGPISSGFMSVAGVSWRWTYWLMTIFAGVCTIVVALTVPETYGYVQML
jgi:MFS family permease